MADELNLCNLPEQDQLRVLEGVCSYPRVNTAIHRAIPDVIPAFRFDGTQPDFVAKAHEFLAETIQLRALGVWNKVSQILHFVGREPVFRWIGIGYVPSTTIVLADKPLCAAINTAVSYQEETRCCVVDAIAIQKNAGHIRLARERDARDDFDSVFTFACIAVIVSFVFFV